MTERQVRSLIEKLSRLTENRGATKEEAARAAAKVRDLKARLPKSRPVYVEGWPGQPTCEHQPDRATYYHNQTLVCRKCGSLYHPEVYVWSRL